MNKKVSTLFAASLLFSSAFGMVYAENVEFPLGELLKSVENNSRVVFLQKDASGGQYVLGFELSSDKKTITPAVHQVKAGNTLDREKLANYTWNVLVSENTQKDPTYVFVNAATGDTLSFDSATDAFINTPKSAKEGKYLFYWTDKKNEYDDKGYRFVSATDLDAATSSTKFLNLSYPNNVAINSSKTLSTYLYKLGDSTIDDEHLNALFNTKGFNLDAASLLGDDVAVQGNLFKGDTRIWAFEVNADNIREAKNEAKNEDETAVIGYKISAAGMNGTDLVIPNGLYFFTERVLKTGANPESLAAEDIDWEASKLIAVSPTQTVENTVNNRDEGQGFTLIEVSLSDLLFEKNTSEFVVGETPIYNACFTAMYNNAGAYALRLNNFYYQKNSTDKEGTALTPTKADLVVLKFTDNTQYLTTAAIGNAYDYIFTLSDSAVKNGIDLLNTEKKAAVYNIKFISGNNADEELFGKYLTSGVTTKGDGTKNEADAEVAKENKFVWVAKGTDISKLNYPEFQYTITKVEKEADKKNDPNAKYVNVTFTNRETNENFTVKLFPEEGGENYYSLSFVSNDITVIPVDVKSNNYGVEKSDDAIPFDEDIIIQLIPSEVNEYAGFLNVEDKSIRTIRFARDKYSTSYQWYAGVGIKSNEYTLTPSGAKGGYFVEDIYDAAQWQLVKVDSSTIARTYVYNAGTGSVNDVANGDKLSAYVYQLQYINDGTETGYYLADNSIATIKKDNKNDENTEFYIKENADGSVSIFRTDEAFKNVSGVYGARVTKPEKNVSIDAKVDDEGNISYLGYTNSAEHRSAIYSYVSSDINLKTYLDSEIPNISWTEEGHVTLQNGTAGITGNCISVNDKGEGIVIDEATDVLYLHMTDENAVIPSFYISKGLGEGSNGLSERLFMFNPTDSVDYQVNRPYDPEYQLAAKATKAIFKAGTLDASRDTMTTSIKGEVREIAEKADNDGVWGGLNRFKFQIVDADDDSYYNIRQGAGYVVKDKDGNVTETKTAYLASNNEKLYFTDDKDLAMAIYVDAVEAPTANEGVSATEVKVVAYDGAINIKNAAGKNVVVSTILGQIVANEVLTSDNATISVPAGIAIVSVDGEEAVKVSVR